MTQYYLLLFFIPYYNKNLSINAMDEAEEMISKSTAVSDSCPSPRCNFSNAT
jgi:hypothetical protein